MKTINVSDILAYCVPLLLTYLVYLHKVTSQLTTDVAVNIVKDTEIMRRLDVLESKIDKLIRQ